MKKLTLLLLILNYQTNSFAQLNKILYKEFCGFVEAHKSGQPIEPKVDPLVYLQLDEPTKSYKNKIKKQVLDSVVTYQQSAYIKKTESFTYDKSGNQLSVKQEYLNLDSTVSFTLIFFEYENGNLIGVNYEANDHDWISKFKAEYFYKKGKLINYRSLLFDEQKNEWRITNKVEFAYNTNNQISNINYYLIDSWQEDLQYSTEYTYNKSEIIAYEFFPAYSINVYGPRQSIYTFNKHNKIVDIEKKITITSVTTGEKETFIYDEHGKLSSTILYSLFPPEKDWNLFSEQSYFYNRKGEIAHKSKVTHYGPDNTRIEKTSFTYDAYGFLSTGTVQEFNESEGIFENESKEEFFFDPQGNLQMSANFSWSGNKNDWEKTVENKNVFNTDFSFTEDVLYPGYLILYNNWPLDYVFIPTYSYYGWFNYSEFYGLYDPFDHRNWNMQIKHTEFNYNRNGEISEESLSAEFYYSERDVSLNNKTQPNIIVNPNPAYNYFTIDLPTMPIDTKIKMYNLNGLKVMEQPVFKGELIYINHLQSGLYYFKLFASGNKLERTGKLMIR